MSQPINPDFPIGPVNSVEALMDLACGMEHDAAVRYDRLADSMDHHDEPALAALFRDLAVLEREHEEGIARWAVRDDLPQPRPADLSWRLPETFGDEADGAEALVLTPYQALAIAVRNEERAFAFYTYVAAMAEDPEVQRRAESLAREELNHVAQLRAWRRRSFHTGRAEARRPPVPRSLKELRGLAHGLETASAELDDAVASSLEAAGAADAAVLLRQAALESRRQAGLCGAPPGGEAPRGSRIAEGARTSGMLSPGSLTPKGALRLSLRNAEEVLEAYLDTADRASDQHLLGEAQRLAEAAVARLALVRSLMPEEREDDGA